MHLLIQFVSLLVFAQVSSAVDFPSDPPRVTLDCGSLEGEATELSVFANSDGVLVGDPHMMKWGESIFTLVNYATSGEIFRTHEGFFLSSSSPRRLYIYLPRSLFSEAGLMIGNRIEAVASTRAISQASDAREKMSCTVARVLEEPAIFSWPEGRWFSDLKASGGFRCNGSTLTLTKTGTGFLLRHEPLHCSQPDDPRVGFFVEKYPTFALEQRGSQLYWGDQAIGKVSDSSVTGKISYLEANSNHTLELIFELSPKGGKQMIQQSLSLKGRRIHFATDTTRSCLTNHGKCMKESRQSMHRHDRMRHYLCDFDGGCPKTTEIYSLQ